MLCASFALVVVLLVLVAAIHGPKTNDGDDDAKLLLRPIYKFRQNKIILCNFQRQTEGERVVAHHDRGGSELK